MAPFEKPPVGDSGSAGTLGSAGALRDEIGDRVRYRIVRKIAEGGMGAVYEAVLEGSDGFTKTVAIKAIRPELTSDRAFVEMFIAEAKLSAALVHQNIVQIYQLGQTEGVYYMAMEYVEGVHLADFIARHTEQRLDLPIDLAVYILSRVARGLEYAHKKRDREGRLLGVVHRDVSPKNVILAREGFVKLADFGIAKARTLQKDLEGEVLMGKVRYMSPEQATFLPTDARSDLFSLGIVAYELLTGQVVFGADSTTRVIDAVSRRPVEPLQRLRRDVPAEVSRIVMKSLERDPARRYQDAGEFALDLEQFIYHDRFGPTVVTLEKYLLGLFPERFPPPDAMRT